MTARHHDAAPRAKCLTAIQRAKHDSQGPDFKVVSRRDLRPGQRDCVGQCAESLGAIAGSTGLTVYYDGSCPLCAREIGFYRRQDGADQIRWIDVAGIDGIDIAPDLSRKQALARFTVRDSDGRLVSGGKGFTRIWRQLPRFRWLAAIFERQPFIWMLERAYAAFLRHRPLLQAIAKSRQPMNFRK